jgi:dTMP kinase
MLIAIEGIDGCGKGTLTSWLSSRAEAESRSVCSFSFPRYGTNAYAAAISRYLNGGFGDVGDVAPEFAAVLYAGDRLVAKDEIETALSQHDFVICDRYVPSNMAHQAAKLPIAERTEFLRWLEEIEYALHALPRPDLIVRLDMPVALARELVGRKQARAYTARAADIHESDQDYLAACAGVYDQLVADDSQSWLNVSCVDERGELLTVDEIGSRVWNAVQQKLEG